MNLMDKYIAEVGKHLPRKQRADIGAEIRSTLEDMLQERKQAPGEVNEAMVIELLQEYGEPRKVAESYVGPNFLIGPLMYPRMVLVAKIVLGALFMGLLISFGFSVVRSDMTNVEIAQGLTRFIGSYILAAISALGNIVLIFAVLERLLPAEVTKGLDEKWDPTKLSREPDPDAVKIGEEVIEIFFTLLFLILFNFFSDKVGIYIFSDSQAFFIPLLTEVFFRYLPWWTVIGVAQIALNFVLLSAGTWTKTTRLATMGLRIATVLLVIAILQGPPIMAFTPENVAGTPLATVPATTLGTLSGFVLIPFFLAIVIASLIEIGQILVRLWNAPTHEPFPIKR